jgi:hypothetical protein
MQVVKRILRAIAAASALLVAASPAAAYKIRELGTPGDSKLPAPGCPENCEVLAHVTGYQVQFASKKNPYQVNHTGKVVAFTIGLGKPSQKNITGFNRAFGQPQARLSILKLAKTKRRARLVAQSEVFNLTPYLGSTPTFALDRPLPMGPRHVAALTIPTWAPAFAIKQDRSNAWRAPRDPGDCDDLETPATHQTVGSLRRYACFYRTARLVYSVSFIRDPETTNDTKK